MRILYICDQSPFEHYNGSQQRSGLLLDALCLRGQVDLVCFTSDATPHSVLNPNCNIKFFEELPAISRARIVQRIVKLTNLLFSLSPYSVYNKNSIAYDITHDLLKFNDYNYIVIRYIKNAFMCGLFKDKRIIVDIDDLPEQSILSYLEINRLHRIRYFQYRYYALRAKFHTNRFIKGIYHSFCSNKFQCEWINSSYLPNIPFPALNSNNNPDEMYSSDDNIVLFVGFLVHTPNFQGVQYFLDNIWGCIREAIPNAIFKIAGKGVSPEQKIAWEMYEGVHVLGFVSDIQSEYKKCRVVAIPIYSGAGSNIKVLEAMSLKKATVISEFASRPFKDQLIENKNIMIAHNPKDFADKVIKLLIDKKLNSDIAENAAKLISENYSYSNFLSAVHKYIV